MNDERCDLLCVDAPGAEEIRWGLPSVEAVRGAAERTLSDPTRLMLAAALREVGSCAFATLLMRQVM
jgi:hypothetical protein